MSPLIHFKVEALPFETRQEKIAYDSSKLKYELLKIKINSQILKCFPNCFA